MDLDAAADELYGLEPSAFVDRRSALAAEARAGGDRSLAQSIGRLRKPSVSAWLTNQLARDSSESLHRLLDLGDALRKAQERLAGDELRRLAQQGRSSVDGLVDEAAALAQRAGQKPSASTLAEVEATLQAALADPAVGDEVRAGHLTAPLAHTGFGPLPTAAGPSPSAAATPARTRASAAAEQAEARLEERRREHVRARERHESADKKVRTIEAELRAARAEATAAERALREAERRLERAHRGSAPGR
jgi:hypothetical protein